jgi:hypothetical protein
MVNFLQKLFLKPIKVFLENIKPYLIRLTKLYFLPVTAFFNIRKNGLNEEWYFLMDKNHHYGFIIEAIILKLKLMKKSWPRYKYSERELESLDILITKGTELLDILELEDAENHLRSKEYQIKQKQFFDLLGNLMPELFY